MKLEQWDFCVCAFFRLKPDEGRLDAVSCVYKPSSSQKYLGELRTELL